MKLRREGEPDREICGHRAASCICRLDPDHDGIHVCAPGCGGSWEVVDGDFHVVTFPNGWPDMESINDVFILVDGEGVPPDDDNSLAQFLRRREQSLAAEMRTTEGGA